MLIQALARTDVRNLTIFYLTIAQMSLIDINVDLIYDVSLGQLRKFDKYRVKARFSIDNIITNKVNMSDVATLLHNSSESDDLWMRDVDTTRNQFKSHNCQP